MKEDWHAMFNLTVTCRHIARERVGKHGSVTQALKTGHPLLGNGQVDPRSGQQKTSIPRE
jgi:hypothetical protein